MACLFLFAFLLLFSVFYVRVRLCILGLFFSSRGAHDTGCVKCTPYVHQLLVRVLAYVSAPAVADFFFSFFCETKYKCRRKWSKTWLFLFVCLLFALGGILFLFICVRERYCVFSSVVSDQSFVSINLSEVKERSYFFSSIFFSFYCRSQYTV